MGGVYVEFYLIIKSNATCKVDTEYRFIYNEDRLFYIVSFLFYEILSKNLR